MTLPPLPTPFFVEGRMLYTAADVREYAQAAIDAQPKPRTPQAKYGPIPDFLRGMRR